MEKTDYLSKFSEIDRARIQRAERNKPHLAQLISDLLKKRVQDINAVPIEDLKDALDIIRAEAISRGMDPKKFDLIKGESF